MKIEVGISKNRINDLFEMIHNAGVECEKFPPQTYPKPLTVDYWEGYHEGLYAFMKACGLENMYFEYRENLEDCFDN